jgi:LPXTG-motif cell wall-anchored protein
MFTQTSSAYLNLEPVSADSGGGSTNTIVVIGIALVAAGVVFTLVRSRRKKSADDRA